MGSGRTFAAVGVLALVIIGCGSDSPDGADLRSQLNALPFPTSVHEVQHSGDGDVLAGSATRHGVTVTFTLSIGHPTSYAHPPSQVGGLPVMSGDGDNYAFWTDANRPGSPRLVRQRALLSERIIQALCVTAAGHQCGV